MRSAVALVVLVCFNTWTMAASVQVTSVTGSVTAQTGTGPEQRLRAGDILAQRAVVATGQGSTVVLRFDDGQVVALKSLSRFTVESYNFDPKNPGAGEIIMSLFSGGMRAITGLVGNTNRSAFALKTPVATIGIRGTDFFAALYQGLYAHPSSGAIGVTSTKGTGAFSAGEYSFTASSTVLPTSIPESALPAGIFSELQTISLGAAGGAAQGASVAGFSGTTLGVIGIIAVGIAAAAAAASGGGSSTTNH
jgi:hypothetical protein